MNCFGAALSSDAIGDLLREFTPDILSHSDRGGNPRFSLMHCGMNGSTGTRSLLYGRVRSGSGCRTCSLLRKSERCSWNCRNHAGQRYCWHRVPGCAYLNLLALKWSDVHFNKGEIRPCRAIVDQVVGNLKTEASGKAVPMDAALAEVLLDWRGRCPYNQDADYIFGSPEMDGEQPYCLIWRDAVSGLPRPLGVQVVR